MLADRDALAQAVLNLLSNAIKFRREDPAARQIDLLVERSNGAACIRVCDRGRGISPAARPHIFERFYRSPEAEQAGIPGTGLGPRPHGARRSAMSADPKLRKAISLRCPFACALPNTLALLPATHHRNGFSVPACCPPRAR